MNHTNSVEILIAYFSNYIKMSEEEIELLKQVVVYKKWKKKEIIHREGDIQKYLAFVLKGAVRFYYIDEKGDEQTSEFVFENTIIGQYKALIDSNVASAYAETIEDTELLGVSKDGLLKFLNQFPKYYAVMTDIMGDALVQTELRNKLLRIASSRERYEELCRLQPQIVQRIPLTYIASYLKMALGTLSRVRAGKL